MSEPQTSEQLRFRGALERGTHTQGIDERVTYLGATLDNSRTNAGFLDRADLVTPDRRFRASELEPLAVLYAEHVPSKVIVDIPATQATLRARLEEEGATRAPDANAVGYRFGFLEGSRGMWSQAYFSKAPESE